MGLAPDPTAPQRCAELAFQLAVGMDVDGLVVRLAAHAHLRVIGKLSPKSMSDLLRRPPLLQLQRDVVTQRALGGQLRCPGALASLDREPMSGVREIAALATVLRRSGRLIVEGERSITCAICRIDVPAKTKSLSSSRSSRLR